MRATYQLSEAEGVKYLVPLDRIGILELRPLNRYRLKLAKTFRWCPPPMCAGGVSYLEGKAEPYPVISK